jgi:hypothetical protein
MYLVDFLKGLDVARVRFDDSQHRLGALEVAHDFFWNINPFLSEVCNHFVENLPNREVAHSDLLTAELSSQYCIVIFVVRKER